MAFAAGALSGAIAATLTLPFDVVKTRQQSLLGRYVQACAEGTAQQVPKESAVFIVREVLRNYGVPGLFAGVCVGEEGENISVIFIHPLCLFQA